MRSQNLALQPTPFIGREQELVEIGSLLANPDCRLLTLVGPGGIGKTRITLEVARIIAGDVGTQQAVSEPPFPDGICFTPLQPLASPDFIVPAIASVLNFTFYGERDPKQQLLDFLRDKRLLLVLDNFEHLLDGVGLLPEVLEYAPGVKLLVSSRERLHLREEWVIDVHGLTFPENGQVSALDDYTAVQLFIQTARRAGYAPADADTTSIVRICQIVEGIPLAIELAAPWVRIMSCAEIAREVERSLDILTTTTRNVPEKHRSMRAAFERSWDLLTDEEQAVFRKLSVFCGGFTRESSEQVAGATLATLASLVDKSLVKVDASGRYDLHELLRQYAANKLLGAHETDATVQHHYRYFLRLAEEAESHTFGRDKTVWYDRLEVELDNIRAALALSAADETGLRLAGALGWFFNQRSHWNEGLEWLERILAANQDAPASLRAKALHSAGALAGQLGDEPRLRALCEEALALARTANDRWNIAWSLGHLGFYAHSSDPNQTAALLDESLALFRELEDPMGVTHTLGRRAYRALDQKDYSYVRLLLEELTIRVHEAGDKVIAAWAAYLQGRLAWEQDYDLNQVKIYYENSLAHYRQVRDQDGINLMIFSLAGVEQAMGNMDRATVLNEEALIRHMESAPNHPRIPSILASLASVARAGGQFERAARLLGAANNRRLVQFAALHPEMIPFESDFAAVRAQLGEKAFAEAWVVGKAMTFEQAVAYALEGSAAEPVPAERATDLQIAQPVSQPQTDPLSERELEMLRLIADGLSNREISEELFLTVNTVKWYLKGIFGKLHVANRAQAVARAQVLGLLS